MRRAIFRAATEVAVELFRSAEVVHLASVTPGGRPVLRTVHGVVVDGALAWHGAPNGEKTELAGQPGVVSCERIVANVPSHFVDPERACPATTYYESAQAAGPIEVIEDHDEKARALQALMERYQPEGGYRPIVPDDPLYKNAVKNLALWRISLADAVAKVKLGQHKKPHELAAIVEGLWRRGAPRDLEAIERILAANPEAPCPGFLAAPEGVSLFLRGRPSDLPRARALLLDTYWNVGVTREQLDRSHLGSPVWVGARDASERLIGTARAVTDGAKHAWIYDVAVDPQWRRTGVGRAVLGLVLDHPAVRDVKRVWLGTRDQQRFYGHFGFEVVASKGVSEGTTVMARVT